MGDTRSGDIILLSNYSKQHRNAIASVEGGDPQSRDGGYYFGGQLHCWHGSLYDTDMTIPLVFSFPRGDGSDLSAFLGVVNSGLSVGGTGARITHISPIVYRVLTAEELP